MSLSIKQEMLLDLMVRADKIMKEHDITYFLFGGSTLGALRHEGFIPWDDDIDIIIDVDNYKKLQELFSAGPIDDIDLVFFEDDPEWYRPFAMLVSQTDTCYTMPVAYSTGKAVGSRIDVMICDYVPLDRLEEYRHDLMLYEEVLSDTLITDWDVYLIKDEYFALRERMAEIGKVNLEKELRSKLESYATSDDDKLVVRFWTKELRYYDRDLLYPPLYHNFEGHMLPIPARPEEQLRLQFGNDWYIIPEQDQQMSHAFVDNYYISGNNYHEDILHFIDKEKSEKIARERKANLISNHEYMLSNRYYSANLTVQRELMRAGFKKNRKEYDSLIENREYKQLVERLAPLTRVLKAATYVEKIHKEIPADIANTWLRGLVYCGKYFIAAKVINSYELEESAEVSESINLIKRVTELANLYQDRKTDELKKHLSGFSAEERKMIPDCIYAEIMIGREEGSISDDEIIAICDDYLKLFPDNYEMLKIKADCLFNKNKTEEAMALYDEVHENTVNGFDLYDIEKRFDFPKRFGREKEDPLDIMMKVSL